MRSSAKSSGAIRTRSPAGCATSTATCRRGRRSRSSPTSTPPTRARSLGLPSSNVTVNGELGPMPAWLIPAERRNLGDRRPRPQRSSARGPADRPHPTSPRPADPPDHLPRGPRRPCQSGRIPPSGLDRVARPRRGGPLRARPRGASLGPDRLLDGRRDRRPVHGALAARRSRLRVGARRPRPRLAGGDRIPRDGDGPAGSRRAPGRVGDRRPHRRRLGQTRRQRAHGRPPSADPALPWHRRRRRADIDQRRVRRRATALGHLLPRPDAGHTESWNVDPRRYERRLGAFLDRVAPR